MKSIDEITREARKVIRMGREFEAQQRRISSSNRPDRSEVPLRLGRSSNSSSADEAVEHSESGNAGSRTIIAVIRNETLYYQLLEDGANSSNAGHDDTDVLLESSSGLEIVSEAYQLIEEERIAEELLPYTDRVCDVDLSNESVSEEVRSVEKIVGATRLIGRGRTYARRDVVEFLEGRLDPSTFINRSIERVRSHESQRFSHAQRQQLRLNA